jgi:hypothetical protein
MIRSVAIILCAVMLDVSPRLCATGILTHPCDCAETTGSRPGCDGEPDAACPHEADCADDPCSPLVAKPTRKETKSAAPASAPMVSADMLSDEYGRLAGADRNRRSVSLTSGNLPYPPSDLPLLL